MDMTFTGHENYTTKGYAWSNAYVLYQQGILKIPEFYEMTLKN